MDYTSMKWNKESYKEFISELKGMQDEKYREFHNKKNNYNFVDDSSTSCININIDNSLKEAHELKKDFEKIKEENEILQKAISILAKKN